LAQIDRKMAADSRPGRHRAARAVDGSFIVAEASLDAVPAQPAFAGAKGRDLAALSRRVDRPVVLVGLMGAGKTVIGRRLAAALHIPFADADAEIERAAGAAVQDIFARHGEPEFRRGERQVIARLMRGGPMVLATGGGAYIDADTRALIKREGFSIWLKADLDTLMRRVEKRDHRPLLKADDPRAVMAGLMDKRYPIYAEADAMVMSGPGPHLAVLEACLAALAARFAAADGDPT
jgi:shikimate kinase